MELNQSVFKQCEICQIEATSLCLDCNSYYCDKCFKFIHDINVNKNHKKEKIDYYAPFDTKCPDHPKNPINLFCCDEKGNILLF